MKDHWLKLKNGDIWHIYLPLGYDLEEMTLTTSAKPNESDKICEEKNLSDIIVNGRCWTVRRRN